MQRSSIRFTCWLLIFALLASPLRAEYGSPEGFSLLGVETAAAAQPAARPLPPAPVLGDWQGDPAPPPPPRVQPAGGGLWNWAKDFGLGAVDGFFHALPNLVRSFRESPLTTSLTLGGMIALGLAWPPGALLAGAGMMGHAAWQAGLDPKKLGNVVGETAFWAGAGAAAARGVKALRGTAAAAEGEGAAAKYADLFKNQERARLPEWIGAGEMPHQNSYRQILKTFENPEQSARLAGMLEAEVTQMAASQNISRQAALETILSRGEKAGGFKPAIDLENRSYTPAEFNDMLRQGSLFRDGYFAGKPHAAQTHRVQWDFIMRDMKLNPQKYARADGSIPRPVDLLTTMGDPAFTSRLKGDMWSTLFDSLTDNFTRPEFVKSAVDSNWAGMALW
jgi:hypothetical protein